MTCVSVACLCVEDVIIQTRHMLHHPIKSLLSETVMHTAGFPVLHLCHGKKMLSKKTAILFDKKWRIFLHCHIHV